MAISRELIKNYFMFIHCKTKQPLPMIRIKFIDMGKYLGYNTESKNRLQTYIYAHYGPIYKKKIMSSNTRKTERKYTKIYRMVYIRGEIISDFYFCVYFMVSKLSM